MVSFSIVWYSLVLQGIVWCCVVSFSIVWYSLVLQGIVWYCVLLHGAVGIARDCLVISGIV